MSNIEQKIWRILPSIDNGLREKLPEYDRTILQLLYNRGIIRKNAGADEARREIDEFLYPDYEHKAHDPWLFTHMAEAVELIVKHLKAKDKIVVYGDYDADGVTASSVLYETLSTLLGAVNVYIPDRVSEGYGLNKGAIDEIIKTDAKLIITVDTGIRNKTEVEYAQKKGLDVIITDHHVPSDNEKEMPKCPVINPMVPKEKYPFRFLAGVGVAFKLASALVFKAKLADSGKKALTERLLDIVAIGTVADCVGLKGENRILTARGLEILNRTKRPGLLELMDIARINNGKRIDSWNIAFQIAPRLNAAGRMGHANTAFELLTTKIIEEAKEIAKRLNDRNSDRQQVTEEITAEVEKQIKEEDTVIVGVCPRVDEKAAWNEGVIGLVAGRISERYYRPVLVITRSGHTYRGSGRSVKELNLIATLEEANDELLTRYGGHAGACGFSLEEKNLDAFLDNFRKAAEKRLRGVKLVPQLEIETELTVDDIKEDLIERVNKLKPFGRDNERPKFVSFNLAVADIIFMGIDRQHIKLRLKGDAPRPITAVGFNQAEKWGHLRAGDRLDMVYYMEMNEFNGRREEQLKIVDIKQR